MNRKMVALVLIGAMVMTMAAVLAYDLYDSDTENGTYGIAHAWVGADLDESGYIEHHYHGGHGGWVYHPSGYTQQCSEQDMGSQYGASTQWTTVVYNGSGHRMEVLDAYARVYA